MERIRRFVRNAGWAGAIPFAIVALGLAVFIIPRDIRLGRWGYTLPAFCLPALGAYPIRKLLVEHIANVRRIMNGLVISAAIALAALGRLIPTEELWFSVLLAAFMGAYLGCYFWMLSDEEVGRIG